MILKIYTFNLSVYIKSSKPFLSRENHYAKIMNALNLNALFYIKVSIAFSLIFLDRAKSRSTCIGHDTKQWLPKEEN